MKFIIAINFIVNSSFFFCKYCQIFTCSIVPTKKCCWRDVLSLLLENIFSDDISSDSDILGSFLTHPETKSKTKITNPHGTIWEIFLNAEPVWVYFYLAQSYRVKNGNMAWGYAQIRLRLLHFKCSESISTSFKTSKYTYCSTTDLIVFQLRVSIIPWDNIWLCHCVQWKTTFFHVLGPKSTIGQGENPDLWQTWGVCLELLFTI